MRTLMLALAALVASPAIDAAPAHAAQYGYSRSYVGHSPRHARAARRARIERARRYRYYQMRHGRYRDGRHGYRGRSYRPYAYRPYR